MPPSVSLPSPHDDAGTPGVFKGLRVGGITGEGCDLVAGIVEDEGALMEVRGAVVVVVERRLEWLLLADEVDGRRLGRVGSLAVMALCPSLVKPGFKRV